MRFLRRWRVPWAACWCLLGTAISVRAATVSTVVPCLECTGNLIKGQSGTPGDRITVVEVKTGKEIGSDTVGADGTWQVYLPAGTGQVSATSEAGDPIMDVPPVIQPLLGSTSFDTHSLLPGSSATFGSDLFSLAGSFTIKDTDVIYDSTSPDFGKITGVVLASSFSILGSGPGGSLSLDLLSDAPWTINMAPAWAAIAAKNPTQTLPFTVPLSGMATLNGSSTPFSGNAIGTVTFSEPLSESIHLNFDFTTAAGSIAGTVNSFGIEDCPTPEPASIVLLAGGVLLFGGIRRYAMRR